MMQNTHTHTHTHTHSLSLSLTHTHTLSLSSLPLSLGLYLSHIAQCTTVLEIFCQMHPAVVTAKPFPTPEAMFAPWSVNERSLHVILPAFLPTSPPLHLHAHLSCCFVMLKIYLAFHLPERVGAHSTLQ